MTTMRPDVVDDDAYDELTLACDCCGQHFTASADYEPPDRSVGISGGWSASVDLPDVPGRYDLHQCDGIVLLDDAVAARIALAGGVAAVVDCDAVIDAWTIADMVKQRADDARGEAMVDRFLDARDDDGWR